MRIPHIIHEKTIKAYEISNIYLRKEQIKSYDFSWNVSFVTSLRELCLITIALNWQTNPIFSQLEEESDKLRLLELLSTDLPLKLTVPIIEDDYYWKRYYEVRWPQQPSPNRRLHYDKPINVINESVSSQDSAHENATCISQSQFHYSEEEILIFGYEDHNLSNVMLEEKEIKDENEFTQLRPVRKSSISLVIIKSWKQTFLQKFLEDEIEKMKPDMFNPEYIKLLTELVGEYIYCLNLRQLQACKNVDSYDHISLHSLIARLPMLIEFSVCFNQANLTDEFNWHATKVSEADCELLGQGIEKSRLKVLRVLRSDIDCNKVKLLIRPLCKHKYLHTLDLSHCKVADEGALAIAGMLTENYVLEKLILVNNKIGPKGANGLAFYMCHEECKLVELNLKLNPISVEGGKIIATCLARGAKTLLSLNISCCGLTTQNMHLGLALALNESLQKLDLSNNDIGEVSGENFLRAMENNKTLIHLDLRMCGLLPETVQVILKSVRKNLVHYRNVLTTPPNANLIL